jgi:hypothetical protein
MRVMVPAIVLAVTMASGCSAPNGDWESTYEAESSQPAIETSPSGGLQTSAVKTGLPRKIIHTASISLVVEDFALIPKKVVELATQFDGYVAKSNVSGSPGQPRRGSWTIRSPVDTFEALLAAAGELGEPRSITSDSQDISEEYYDVESRVRNKKNTESRLLTLLEESTGNLEQVLIVEEKLDQVREEIERMQGRVRVIQDMTSMTTLNLTIDEIKDFVPQESATYGTRIHRAYSTSVTNLSQTVQDISVAAVYILPWLAAIFVVAAVLLLTLFLARKVLGHCRKGAVRATVVESPPTR